MDSKIDVFHDRIEKLQKDKNLESFFEVKESYDQIKLTVFEILKTIEVLLQESKIEKLSKTIYEDLSITYQKNEKFEEETKGEPKQKIKKEKKEKERFLKTTRYFW